MPHDYQLLIKNLLLTPISYNPNQEIVYKGEKRFSYKEFHQRVKKLANALTQMGVKKGDTVAVMDYDSNRYLECYFAVPMIGAILHTINVRLSPEQILYTIDHAEDDVLFIHNDFLPILNQIKGRIDTVKEYVILNEDESCEYEKMLITCKDDFEFPEFDENTIATTFYTTGTTGMPKGVYFSHRQLVLHTLGTISSISSVENQGRFAQGDVYMPITPMFHVHAWGLPYIATMLGVKQVYPGKYIPDVLIDLIDKERVTFSHCVPTILHMLLNSPKIDDIDLSNWKVIIGGAALPKAMCVNALKKGIDIFTGYGMSETCPILSLAHLDEKQLELDIEDQADIRVKTGKATALVELKIADEEMKEVPTNETGEIIVRTPWLTQGYFKDKKNSEALWRGGYLHTGDIAYEDDSGFIKITDRAKDIIKISGEWVSSLELEDIINQHPDVSEVAFIGQPHEKWGEIPLGLVVLKEGSNTTQKELEKFVKDFIKKGIISREGMLLKVQFVEAIDKTSVGKINKRELRQKYATLYTNPH